MSARVLAQVMFTSTSRTAVILGPLDDPLNIVYALRDRTNTAGRVLAFGPNAALVSIPEGYHYEVIVGVANGPTRGVKLYGDSIVTKKTKPATSKQSTTGSNPNKAAAPATPTSPFVRGDAGDNARMIDSMLTHVSAWTDNGAYNFWNAQGRQTLASPSESNITLECVRRIAQHPSSVLQCNSCTIMCYRVLPCSTCYAHHSYSYQPCQLRTF